MLNPTALISLSAFNQQNDHCPQDGIANHEAGFSVWTHRTTCLRIVARFMGGPGSCLRWAMGCLSEMPSDGNISGRANPPPGGKTNSREVLADTQPRPARNRLQTGNRSSRPELVWCLAGPIPPSRVIGRTSSE